MVKVNIINNYHKKFLKNSLIKQIADYTLKTQNKDNVEMSIVLCDNKEMKEYNSTYRGKDYPTDVLSFVDGERIGRYIYLGDIIISIDKVIEQSKEFEVEPEEEFVRLLVHGILHLIGYDHETSEEDEKIMMEIQDKIIDEVMTLFFQESNN
ncbi:MAG: rRNA maturation RNase YbeY [Brevinematia bacterium]